MSDNPRLIPRDHYLEMLESAKDTPFIKVLTGIRRCGKSTILEMFKENIISSGVPPEQVISVNFDIDSPDTPKDHTELTRYVTERTEVKKGTYIILDEIQNVCEWEVSVTSFYTSGADVYITGSNSRLLSSELATKLSGRCIEIDVRPLVFSEYLNFRKSGQPVDRLFTDYVRDGGMPAIAISEDTDARGLIPDMLSGIFNTVFVKDVIERCRIRNPAEMANISRFLMRNIGDRTSPRSVSNYLTSNGQKISHITAEEYLAYLTEAYLFTRSERIDSKTKKYLHTTDKFYCSDLGIRNSQIVLRTEDLDGILENIVFNELLYRFKRVVVCSVRGCEVDFEADPEGTPSYYQVCLSINDPTTREKELRPLRCLDDHYPKTVITYDRFLTDDIEGIRVVQVIDWLTEDH